jgi:hypothetical protein
MYPTVAVMMHMVCTFLSSDVSTVNYVTSVCMCVYVATDSNPVVAKRELCVSAAMRTVDDTSMLQCIFLLISISQHVLTLHVFKSLCG